MTITPRGGFTEWQVTVAGTVITDLLRACFKLSVESSMIESTLPSKQQVTEIRHV